LIDVVAAWDSGLGWLDGQKALWDAAQSQCDVTERFTGFTECLPVREVLLVVIKSVKSIIGVVVNE
jgi:hypothetical protein